MIYETLVGETKVRPKRRVEVINLGLDPWAAIEMGLERESVEPSQRSRPVAQYVLDRDDGEHWADWLQKYRIELNAMTTPQFIAWLDGEMAKHAGGKVVPPEEIAIDRFTKTVRAAVRDREVERVLEENDIENLVDEAMEDVVIPAGAELLETVRRDLKEEPAKSWKTQVERRARLAAA